MATAQTVLQVFGGDVPCLSSSKTHPSRSWSGSRSRSFIKYNRRKATGHFEVTNCFSESGSVSLFPRSAQANVTSNRLGLRRCNCELAESVRELTSEDGNGTWNADNDNGPTVVEKAASSSNGSIHSNGTIRDTLHEDIPDSFEDEAWALLKESIVYYCNSPVGTIAAKDPSESNVLNYDHVFIRDFVPSGIAFLLKGEYDIVRNFILHTLQLQVNTFLLYILCTILSNFRYYRLILCFFCMSDDVSFISIFIPMDVLVSAIFSSK